MKKNTIFYILAFTILSMLSCKDGEKTITITKETNMDIENLEYAQNAMGNKKNLIVYFSWGGNTRFISEYIKSITDSDIFEITTVNSYPKEYRPTTEQARQELDSNYLPEIKSKVSNLSSYDTIVLAYPIWWGTFPQSIKVFLTSSDFTGKTIASICTHGGSGMGRSISDIKKYAPNSTITEGLAIRGNSVSSSQNEIKLWLDKIGLTHK